ncbi:MAG: LbtU family siderophore porin [Gammaproteobacteria bacterium]|nr:LbtU family siderophore porin [Gammaproteobacteria bacterium]MXW45184.1 LbtU family siderophore porin [Gammaproteobacteria bacterium]MYD01842.1 LbtU family siderophore porin [Gammaproteobacteria bacterium]MYI26051.1 LbtU family siderophore porin [Gammaproteobacteria bacterium]
MKHPVLACLGLLLCLGAAKGADASGGASAGEDERAGGEWLEIGGHVDLDSVHSRPENEGGYTNTAISEVGLSLAAAVTDWAAVEAGFLYEHTDLGDRENVPGSEATFLETATLRFGHPDGPWSLTAGQQFLPFGVFDTRMFSEPLTLELGETNEIAVSLGWSSGGLTTTLFGFGKNDDLESAGGIAGYGAAVSYTSEREETGLALNLALTSDFSYSANVQGVLADTTGDEGPADRIAGLSAHAALRYGAATLIAEYLGALDSYAVGEMEFAGRGAQPASWLLEAAYDFEAGGMNATAALGYQATREALALELPARRLIAVVSVQLAEPFTLAVEWGRDSDYAAGIGGSGESSTFVTAQLSWAF